MRKANLRKTTVCLSAFFRAFGIAAASVFVIALSSCSDPAFSGTDEHDTVDPLLLVWEAWEKINHRYVSSEEIDPGKAVSRAMSSVMSLMDIPPYPFLTDMGRLRGQPPGHVPEELADLWRAVSKYRLLNPDFDHSTIAEGAVSGLVGGLGDASAVFLDATQYPIAKESLERGIEGSYLGIGSQVVSRDGQIALFPFAGSPADHAGVIPGDVLFAVDGTLVTGRGVEEITKQISGPKGTKIELEVIREGESDPVVLEVFRGDVELQSVASQLIPGGIAYLRISRFRENTGDQVFSALETLNRFDLLALVLDIRTNPGGSSEAARITAGQFLSEGTLYGYIEDGHGNRSKLIVDPYENRMDLDDLLIAVLINDQTAREAETVAAVLQDSGRATLFGTNTFGDASSYEFVELSDGSAIYMPVLRRYTPSGKLIGRTGIAPDVVVQSFPEAGGFGGESQFNRAYEFLDSQLPPFR